MKFTTKMTAAKTAAVGLVAVGIAAVALAGSPAFASPGQVRTTLIGHIPSQVASATRIGNVSGSESISLALTLPLSNQGQLQDLLRGLYDPGDARFHHFLTTSQFVAQFAPPETDYEAVEQYAKSQGLTITGTHVNRAIVDVAGTAAKIQSAFHVKLVRYQAADGRVFRAPDSEPSVPSSLANVMSGIVGLDNATVYGHDSHQVPTASATGTGPLGGFSPSDTKAAYGLTSVTQNGTGQTIALFEAGSPGYLESDVRAFETQFAMPNVVLEDVLVDGATNSPGSSPDDEATMDIDLAQELAPNLTKVMVYFAPQTPVGNMDCYNRMATDDQAQELSTSWGSAENTAFQGTNSAGENTAFEEMAAQGQSMFSASGDLGAYDDGNIDNPPTLSVHDPASQPWVVGVGGTNLTVAAPGGAWQSETSWADPSDTGRSPYGTGGGGGISVNWPIPSWQIGVVSAASLGSTTMRNVPDVSLYGEGETGGYAMVLNGEWIVNSGTSATSPLWASFMALVNQARLANGIGYIGDPNPAIYRIAQTTRYATDFHDIADGSTNLHYPAVTGYDLSTGWGSFIGANLLTDLASGTSAPAIPIGLVATAGVSQAAVTWSAASGATSYNVYRGTASGAESTTAIATGVTSASYTNTGLAAGTTYYYKVASVNATATSALSSEVSVIMPSTGPACYAAWNSATAYSGGAQVSYSNVNYTAAFWSQGSNPSTNNGGSGSGEPWVSDGACGSGGSCSVAPTAPSALAASGTTSYATNLTWTAATVSGNCVLSGYNVYRNGIAIVAGVIGTSYAVTGLSPSTAYAFTVKAVDAFGPSAASNTVNVTTLSTACTAVPPAPAVPTAVTNASGTNVSWTAVAPPTNCTITGYEVYENGTAVVSTPSNSYNFQNLTVGTTYKFTVAAIDSLGTGSQSPSLSVTPTVATCLAAPPAVTGAKATNLTSTGVTISWNTDTAPTNCSLVEYLVTYSLGSVGVTGTTTTFSNLVPNSTYVFTVYAIDQYGESVASGTVSVTTPASCATVPSAPATPTASGTTSTGTTINWTAVTPPTNCTISSYEVYKNGTALASVASGTSYAVTGLTAGTTYKFTVAAVDSFGTGAQSAAVSVTTTANSCSAVTAAPTGLTATNLTSTGVTINWNAVTPPSGCAISQYLVTYSLGSLGVPSGTTATFSSLTQNSTYGFVVYAIDQFGESVASSTLTVTTPSSSICTGVAAWSGNSVSYAIGNLVTYNGSEYKCIQAHTSQAGWDPPAVPSLWTLVGSC